MINSREKSSASSLLILVLKKKNVLNEISIITLVVCTVWEEFFDAVF